MTAADRDPALRRFEIDSVLACLAMAVLALVATAAGQGSSRALRAPLGVLSGGLLMGLSYRAIKGGADALVAMAVRAAHQDGRPAATGPEGGPETGQEAEPGARRPRVLPAWRRVFLVVKFLGRYALLAVAAYVMLARFRLDPVGVLAGATSPFVAALLQVVRMSRARRRHP